jgi:N-methylhydantoinase A
VTDADVTLGYLDPETFRRGAAAASTRRRPRRRSTGLWARRWRCRRGGRLGVSQIVDESMASAGRMHAVESGKDLGDRTMIAFGGNGPLHATRVARRAGVSRILIPRDPGRRLGGGVPACAGLLRDRAQPLRHARRASTRTAQRAFRGDDAKRRRRSPALGAPDAPLAIRRTAFMRYHGQGHEIEIALPDRPLTAADAAEMTGAFEAEYARQFSRAVPGMTIEVLNWAVSVSTAPPAPSPAPAALKPAAPGRRAHRAIACDLTGAPVDAAVYDRAILAPGDTLTGPALIVEPQTTTLVSADFGPPVGRRGNLVLTRATEARHDIEHPTTRLQVMWNRLLAGGRGTGQALIRAAFSPIVRECGDISAGIFDARADAGAGRHRHAGPHQHHGRGGQDPARPLRRRRRMAPATST